MSNNNDNDKPIIEIIVRPVGGQPQTQTFPFTTSSGIISGTTVPQVAGEQVDQAVGYATSFLDNLKGKYSPEDYDYVMESFWGRPLHLYILNPKVKM